MRINVYSEDIDQSRPPELVRKDGVVGPDGRADMTYFGVRVFLATPSTHHQTGFDDDANAVTFWFAPGESEKAGRLFADTYSLTSRIGMNMRDKV